MKKTMLKGFFACAAMLFLASCGGNGMSPADQQKMIDSLVTEQVDAKKMELDSICEATFDAKVTAMVDSLMNVKEN